MTGVIREATDRLTWGPAIDAAVAAVGRGALIVLPTDTVYGIAADAFNPTAVAALLAAKGRGRNSPPPVLIGSMAAMDGLATDIPVAARALATRYWPGALTLIVRSQPSLAWDLGDAAGTVALRMPNHPLALAVLARTGPLACSSANLTALPAAITAAQALDQLGDAVAEYLDGGAATGGISSTIVDATANMRIVRQGAISAAEIELGMQQTENGQEPG